MGFPGDRAQQLGAALAVVLLGCGAGSSSGAAQEITLEALDGSSHSLSTYRGKVVMLQFFASWSKPSRALLKHLTDISRRYDDRGFVVLAISVDGPETVSQVRAQTHVRGVEVPILWDADSSVVAIYNPKRIVPYTVFIGRAGDIVGHWHGHNFADREALEARIEELLE